MYGGRQRLARAFRLRHGVSAAELEVSSRAPVSVIHYFVDRDTSTEMMRGERRILPFHSEQPADALCLSSNGQIGDGVFNPLQHLPQERGALFRLTLAQACF